MSTFAFSFLGIFFGGCLTMAVGLREESVTHRMLESSFLRFFGKYSYCLYICHVPLIIVFAKAGLETNHLTHVLHNKFLAVVAVNGIAFAASIVIALLSWNLFEKQWLKLKNLSSLRRESPISEAAREQRSNFHFFHRTSAAH
jgi:peptidoglycan/LPS O-acetylase OafA/YrhL